MYDQALLVERLEAVLEWLERIPRRFSGISRPEDFQATRDGIDRMDAICMILIAAGEEFKKIDRKTGGELFSRYPTVDWRGAIRVRDVMAHGYFDVNVIQLFSICRDDIPPAYRSCPRPDRRPQAQSVVTPNRGRRAPSWRRNKAI